MEHLVLILGMTVVTYLPRMAPFVLLKDKSLPVFAKRFLEVLPVCALGALLFPDAVASIPGSPPIPDPMATPIRSALAAVTSIPESSIASLAAAIP